MKQIKIVVSMTLEVDIKPRIHTESKAPAGRAAAMQFEYIFRRLETLVWGVGWGGNLT